MFIHLVRMKQFIVIRHLGGAPEHEFHIGLVLQMIIVPYLIRIGSRVEGGVFDVIGRTVLQVHTSTVGTVALYEFATESFLHKIHFLLIFKPSAFRIVLTTSRLERSL